MTEAEALRSAMRALHEIAYGPAGEQAADWEDYANTLRAYAKRALQEIDEEQECGPPDRPIDVGTKVRHVSGMWECGCDNTDGEVTRLSDGADLGEDGPMAFVGTPCGWSWIRVSELRPALVLASAPLVHTSKEANELLGAPAGTELTRVGLVEES